MNCDLSQWYLNLLFGTVFHDMVLQSSLHIDKLITVLSSFGVYNTYLLTFSSYASLKINLCFSCSYGAEPLKQVTSGSTLKPHDQEILCGLIEKYNSRKEA